VEVWLHVLTPALDGGEWVASRPDCFTRGERILGTHWIQGLDIISSSSYLIYYTVAILFSFFLENTPTQVSCFLNTFNVTP